MAYLLQCSRAAIIAGVALAVQTACPAQTSGQNPAACPCPPPKLVRITGHVVDAVTGKPIVGAVVHYFDSNPPLDIRTGKRVREPIAGEVKSGADGSYALPADLPLSSFHVRASAPGYFFAGFRDKPAIVGQKWPADFPRPSHDLRLEPSHGLMAVGASLFEVDKRVPLPSLEITAAALPRDGRSIVLATRGPKLWIVSLPEQHVIEVPLPEELTKSRENIEQIGWDGGRLIFTAGNELAPYVAGASAPDFHVTMVPSPSIFTTRVSVGTSNFGGDRFGVEELSSCDEGNDSPHCGQGGSLVVHVIANGKTIPIKSGAVDDLSYLLDPNFNTIVFSDPEEQTTVRKLPLQVNPSGKMVVRSEKARLMLLNLATGQRSHIDLPGDGSRTLTLLAQQPVVAKGAGANAMRVAFSTEGDCDPQSTEAAQPFAPSGLAGETRNAWSVCIVTIPFPPPTHSAEPAAAKTHPSAQR